MPRIIKAGPILPSGRIAVIVSRYNDKVTDALLQGALAELRVAGLTEDQIDVLEIPGAFELSVTVKRAVERSDVSAVICLGAVIRGETPHFDYICQAAALGIMRAGQDSGKPVTFGVITANTPAQAFERAGGAVGNKGTEAARAAIELLSVLKQWETSSD
ncbi:MAG: 6,7-dimethyl-8-ribityllumazine synthase [Candidatus Zixiibacteriota bacterium]|nr:MAG: 6,7-dimethyl-8-ribityllumazine synthase [candidate division Zixibacteria bacterium]